MLTDEDKAEIAMLCDAALKAADETRGTELDKKLSGIADGLKAVTDACAAMSQRMQAGDQARLAAGDAEERIGRIETLARKTAADARRSTAEDDLNEMGLLTDAQVRADAVATGLGEKCPPPLSGEPAFSYRKRLFKIFRRHSKEFKDVSPDGMTPEVFTAAENQCYADATEAGARPPIVGAGRMIMRERTDGAHTIRTWYGSPSCWMDQFMGQTGQKATGRFLHDNLGNRG